MEMKMLRWIASIMSADRIRNEKVRGQFDIALIAHILRETRLRWHSLRSARQRRHFCERIINLEVPGKRPKELPRQRWLDTMHVCAHPDKAHERAKWCQKIRKADPPNIKENRRGKRWHIATIIEAIPGG
ncbi:hypothetical protein ANCDUO_13327 [Ancylostoma duodenale]|uniref:Uncharacterized protein n=1 Tax=Ancylostoma duodenale TaxID=51022 RepID=A0A0C2D367_9BILA|nr:hypothetical protein ANCDUO_13327 [Ancylostoma duodenale]